MQHVIKFNKNKPMTNPNNGSFTNVSSMSNAAVKFSKKDSIPTSVPNSTLIYTTDTNEIYRGDGTGIKALGPLEIFDSLSDFPEVGSPFKTYLDRSSAKLFFFQEGQYVHIGSGEGINTELLKDKRIGNMEDLVTHNKNTIVEAINENKKDIFRLSQNAEVTPEEKDKYDNYESLFEEMSSRVKKLEAIHKGELLPDPWEFEFSLDIGSFVKSLHEDMNFKHAIPENERLYEENKIKLYYLGEKNGPQGMKEVPVQGSGVSATTPNGSWYLDNGTIVFEYGTLSIHNYRLISEQ